MNLSKYYEVIKNDIFIHNRVSVDNFETIVKDIDIQRKLQKMKQLNGRFENERTSVPIKTRKYVIDGEEQTDKINNKLNVDFFSDIIKWKTGYLFGIPVVYSLTGDYSDQQRSEFDNFLKYVNMEDIDSEVGKMACICGYGVKEAYIDSAGKISVRELDPFSVIFISKNNDITTPDYVIKFYSVYDIEQDSTKYVYILYDEKNKYRYEDDGSFRYVSAKSHLFEYVPIIGFPNNKEMMGQAERVLSLIDAYDRIISDEDNEIEQFRLAYMLFKGVVVDDDLIQKLRQTGGLQIDKEDDVSFLTKEIKSDAIEKLLDRLEGRIYKIAKVPDMNDEAFSGNQSGVAIKYKLMPTEGDSKTTERKTIKGNRNLFKVLASGWRKKRKLDIDYLDINQQFTRNFPNNNKEDSEVLTNLWGKVPRKRAWSLMSFIDDPEAVEKEYEEETEGNEENDRREIEEAIRNAADEFNKEDQEDTEEETEETA